MEDNIELIELAEMEDDADMVSEAEAVPSRELKEKAG